MTRNAQGYRRWYATALLFLTFMLCVPGWAGETVSKRAKKSADDAATEDFTKPLLLNAGTDPTLRYPVGSFSGWSVFSVSYGWFDVTRQTVRYTVVEPKGKADEGFDVPSSEVSDVKLNGAYLTFRGSKKKHMVFYMPQETWGSIHSGPGAIAASGRGAIGTGSMLQALKNFDRVLAMVTPPPPPPPAAVAQPAVSPPPEPKAEPAPAPPAIALINPSGAGANKTIEVAASPLIIRGVAMDHTGIPVVTVNDSPSNMRPQSAQSTEFWSDPIPLQSGDNRIQIIASNAAHAETKLVFVVHYTPAAAPPNPHALGKPDIVGLLSGGVSSSRVAQLVRDRGIKFTPTAEDLNQIREAGGDDDLIQAIQQAAAPAK